LTAIVKEKSLMFEKPFRHRPFECPACDAARKVEVEIAKIKALKEEFDKIEINKNTKNDVFESIKKTIPLKPELQELPKQETKK
jgi:hypothetical protein